MKNINLIKNKEADDFFLRNIKHYNENLFDEKKINFQKSYPESV